MRNHAIRLMAYVAIVLGSILITFFVQTSALGGWIEQRTYDLRFKLRGPLPTLPDIPITILAIDEQTLAKTSDPLLLWHGHFAKVIDGLTQAGAGVIGVDFILADITRFDPTGQQSLSEALLKAGARSVPVVLAYRVRQGGLEQPPEAVRLAALAVDHPLAFINLTTDSDDFVRRQEIEAWSAEGQKQPSFALAIANAFSTKYNRPRKPVPTGSTLFINYRGPEHYERISFDKALKAAETDDQEYLKSHFGGRIVLIGYVGERGDDDFHSTPQYYWSGRSSSGALRTPGIEIHGHAVSTLLSGQYIQPLSAMLQRLVTLALIGIIAVICFGLQPMKGVVVSVAVVAVFITASILAFNAGYAVMMLPPIFGSALMLGLSQTTNFLLEGREKRRLRQLFKRYVNDKVIEQIIATPDKLAFQGRRCRITVLFADIHAFTTRSESMPPEQVVHDLNQYLQSMVQAIESNHGIIDKFIGDGIMALFGLPVLNDPEHTLHAVQAATAMMSALETLNRKLVQDGSKPIRIGIGIHSGEAVVGNIGALEKMDYTAIGDVINTAARIESLTRRIAANVLISSEAYAAVQQTIRGEDLGPQSLKGKDNLVGVHKIY